MFLVSFLKNVLKSISEIEQDIGTGSRFSTSQINEIIQNSKKDNVKFLCALTKINGLTSFDISYIMGSTRLSSDKIEIIRHAIDMYNDSDFTKQGQTLSDYVYKVAKNIHLLNEGNLDVFKELARCKSDIYDFTNALKNPGKYLNQQQTSQRQFSFSRVVIDD